LLVGFAGSETLPAIGRPDIAATTGGGDHVVLC
jgi:hypothetical protein